MSKRYCGFFFSPGFFVIVVLICGIVYSLLEVFVLDCYAYFFHHLKENLIKLCNSKDCETKPTEYLNYFFKSEVFLLLQTLTIW